MSVHFQHTLNDERFVDMAVGFVVGTAFGLGSGGLVWIAILMRAGLADWISPVFTR